MAKAQTKHLVVCLENVGYASSLEKRKIYLIRVVDESGEDYLYPQTFFRAITLPAA
jgi:hypothetical protein